MIYHVLIVQCSHHSRRSRAVRKWLREVQKDVEAVGDAERSLERLRGELAQLRGQLRVEEEETKQVESGTVSKKVRKLFLLIF